MLRRVAPRSSTARSAAQLVQCRELSIAHCPFWGGIANHFLQLAYPSTYTTVSALAYSPVGTVALVVLAYNVSVVGGKHCWYTLELTAKDYLQDQKLAMIVRYLILFTILLSVEAMFVEC